MTTLLRPPIPPRPERLFTVQEYLRMIDTGILTKHDKVELLEGRIVEKMPTNAPHEAALQRIHESLLKALPPAWMVRIEATLKLAKSAPEPDAMVIRGPIDRYDVDQPTAADTLLVIEVSESTLHDDRNEMAEIYAAAGIPFYWIVNLVDRRVETHANPTGPHDFPAYRLRQDVNETEKLTLQLPEGRTIELNAGDIFPRAKNK